MVIANCLLFSQSILKFLLISFWMQFQIALNWLRKAASLSEFEPLGQNDILSSFHALSREFFVLLSLFLLFGQFYVAFG